MKTCECGCGAEVKNRFKRGHMFSGEWQIKVGKQGGRPLGFLKKGLEPVKKPTVKDIYWAAGVWEGEGSVQSKGRSNTVGVTVSQKDRELCDKMAELFGGNVGKYHNKDNVHRKGGDYFVWTVSGARGAGFLMTIYPLLTQRRKVQVKAALDKWKNKPEDISSTEGTVDP